MVVMRDDVARRVRAARAYAGLTFDELAERSDIGRSTLLRIETKGRPIKLPELLAIADACGLPRRWFFDDWTEE